MAYSSEDLYCPHCLGKKFRPTVVDFVNYLVCGNETCGRLFTEKEVEAEIKEAEGDEVYIRAMNLKLQF